MQQDVLLMAQKYKFGNKPELLPNLYNYTLHSGAIMYFVC